MHPLKPDMRANSRIAAWVLSLFILVCGNLSATEANRISGKVLDPKGATVAGAQVTLTNAAGAAIRQATSDA